MTKKKARWPRLYQVLKTSSRDRVKCQTTPSRDSSNTPPNLWGSSWEVWQDTRNHHLPPEHIQGTTTIWHSPSLCSQTMISFSRGDKIRTFQYPTRYAGLRGHLKRKASKIIKTIARLERINVRKWARRVLDISCHPTLLHQINTMEDMKT